MVWDAARAVKIPIIGMGGICDAGDAMQFILAGARAVAVGCASFRQPDTALRVVQGLEDYCVRQGVADIKRTGRRRADIMDGAFRSRCVAPAV